MLLNQGNIYLLSLVPEVPPQAIPLTALKISDTHHWSVFEGAVHGIYRATLEGRFVEVNPALVAMLGYRSAEEVLKLSLALGVFAEPEEGVQLLHKWQLTGKIEQEVQRRRGDQRLITVRLNGRVCFFLASYKTFSRSRSFWLMKYQFLLGHPPTLPDSHRNFLLCTIRTSHFAATHGAPGLSRQGSRRMILRKGKVDGNPRGKDPHRGLCLAGQIALVRIAKVQTWVPRQADRERQTM